MLKGSVDITASKALGTLKSKKVKGFVSKLSNANCKGSALPKETDFFGQFGQYQSIEASLPKKGLRDVFISDEFAPAAGVTGSMLIELEGTAKTFNIAKGVGTLTNVKPYAAGKLTLSEQPTCIGDTAGTHNVLIGGALTVKSPVLGTLSFAAANATSGSIGPGDTFPGSNCNGIGAMALTPSISNTCAMDGTCSIQYATNADSFFDESTDGTQTVVSETIDFGDGTTGTFTNGEADHTYAAAGTYTATITIETSNGQTQTTTTPVYIDA